MDHSLIITSRVAAPKAITGAVASALDELNSLVFLVFVQGALPAQSLPASRRGGEPSTLS